MKSRLNDRLPPGQSERGQLLPISAMVMFTTVVFIMAVYNIYRVERAKLKVQNLADAVALNLAAQQAALLNVIADRNEWMNHMTPGAPGNNDSPSAKVLDNNDQDPCADWRRDDTNKYPPISCVDKGYVFQSRDDAKSYASIIRTVNKGQERFNKIYNKYLGAPNGDSSGSSVDPAKNLEANLTRDIQELGNDKSLQVLTWNSVADQPRPGDMPSKPIDAVRMKPLNFKVVNDIDIQFWEPNADGKGGRHKETAHLGELLPDGNAVGIMDLPNFLGIDKGEYDTLPDGFRMPDGTIPPAQPHMGVGAMVVQHLDLPIGGMDVTAKSVAWVVSRSGFVHTDGPGGVAVFKPTHWVKIGKLSTS